MPQRSGIVELNVETFPTLLSNSKATRRKLAKEDYIIAEISKTSLSISSPQCSSTTTQSTLESELSQGYEKAEGCVTSLMARCTKDSGARTCTMTKAAVS
jgi:lambda repressor-like predicted transcriptional regulator